MDLRQIFFRREIVEQNAPRAMASNDFENLLSDFQRLPDRSERLPTFMEITRYPHYEDVCSNILAFFFNPNQPHGLESLFLDAILRIDGTQSPEGELGSKVSVYREVSTSDGNRIDLLIQSESHAILIENKIRAEIKNPFRDYSNYLDTLPQTHKYKFLLTLTPRSEGAECGFQNITHKQLVKKVRRLLGGYVARGDTRYLTFMLDFLNTLDNLQKDRVMDQAFLDFLKQRGAEVDKFLNEIKTFKEELHDKTERLDRHIDESPYPNVTRSFWGKNTWGGGAQDSSLYDSLGYSITLASFGVGGVVCAVIVDASGWSIEFYPKKRKNHDHQAKLRRLLQRLNIPHRPKEGSTKLFYPTPFGYSEELGRISSVVQGIVRKLATSDGSP